MPRILLPRSCLPLAFLDVNGTPGDLQGNRIFSAKTSFLEASLSPKKHPAGPVVLIAESVVTPCLHAVEQVQPGIYALCQLCPWVTLKDLDRLIFNSKAQPNIRSLEKATQPGNRWWHEATLQGDRAVQISQSEQRKPWVTEGFQLCLKAPMRQNLLAASPKGAMGKIHQEQSLAESENMVQDMPLQETTQSIDEIFNMIRVQYQEALYMSQVRPDHSLHCYSNTDRIRHHWRIMRKDRYLEPVRFFRVTVFRHLIVVVFRNSYGAVS